MKTPSNKAVIVGQRMEMECQTDNRSLFRKWDFLQVGSYTPRTIATNDKSNISIVTNMLRFGVHLDQKGSIVLYSNSTESKDAGVYICQGQTGSTEFKYSAQMIVLGRYSTCTCICISIWNIFSRIGDVQPTKPMMHIAYPQCFHEI